MHWKNFQPSRAITDFLSVLWSIFIATWPAILTNWLSDVLGNYLHINTSVGAWYVTAAAIASILMAILYRSKRSLVDLFNSTQQINKNSTYYWMQ